jgi:hypothetical protein
MNKLLLLLLLSTPAFSYEILQPSQLHLGVEYYDTLRDPYIDQYTDVWTYGVQFGTKIDLFSYKRNRSEYRLFADPTLKFRATESQIRQGGLYYELGVESLGHRDFRLYRRHESLHCLECNESTKKYPLLDSWVLETRWNFK